MEERILELEKKVSYQDHTIEDLNEIVIEQQKEIKSLKEILEDLQRQIVSGEFVKKQEDEQPPPHY